MENPIVVFVHGTGVRKKESDASVELIRSHLKPHGFSVKGAPWGDLAGSRAAEKSIPTFEKTGGKSLTDDDREARTWNLLFADPASELRLLALNKPDQTLPRLAGVLDQSIQGLYRPALKGELLATLDAAGVVDVFADACDQIRRHDSFEELRKRALPPEGPYLDAIANAIVAQAAILDEEKRGYGSAITQDSDIRDALVSVVRSALGPGKAAPGKRIVDFLGKGVSAAFSAAFYAGSYAAGTPYLRMRRGKHASASPLAGDILLYQARGEKIRGLIREQILELKVPVVLLGHSLGGVACVDLLMDAKEAELRQRVKMLATVGSQAPYFYEINALSSLEYGEGRELPAYFPWWLNIYDRADFLSYVGESLFRKGVEDHEVRTHQPFPQSHSAYWSRKATYQHLVNAINKHVFHK